MKYGASSILHILLAAINFCSSQDNHKQTIHNVKCNINNTNCHYQFDRGGGGDEIYTHVLICFFMLSCFFLVKFYLHEKILP